MLHVQNAPTDTCSEIVGKIIQTGTWNFLNVIFINKRISLIKIKNSVVCGYNSKQDFNQMTLNLSVINLP